MNLSDVAIQLNSTSGVKLPPLLFLTDNTRVPDPIKIAEKLPVGSGIILRDYESSDRPIKALTLANICKERSLSFLVGDDIELALKVGAHGVHYREHNIPNKNNEIANPQMIVTTAVHSITALKKASFVGVTAVILSPVFKTRSHPEQIPLGISKFNQLTNIADLPVYALGGINKTNAKELLVTKAIGLAAIDGIMDEFY